MASLAGIIVALLYFSLQYWTIHSTDRQTEATTAQARPLIYSLGVAASGSSLLYYGSTGYAATHGIEFIGLYIGILLVFTLGFPFLLKISDLAKAEGITSISDFIGARYGKSFSVAAIVTAIATIGLIPYFALQMTAIHYLFDVFGSAYSPQELTNHEGHFEVAFLFVLLIGLFTILYSARSTPSTERYSGLLHGLALDTIIKYGALLCVGIGSVTFFFGSPSDVFQRVAAQQAQIPALQQHFSIGNFISLIVLGASTVFLVPSQFHLIVVQHRSDSELRMTRWFIPATLLAVGIFIFPMAIIGAAVLPQHASVDYYFLALPVLAEQNWIRYFAFAGGLAASTTMMVFPSILLSIMISNDLFLPILLRRFSTTQAGQARDFAKILPRLRRAAITTILLLAFGYQFTISGRVDFASLILISNTAMMQLVPSFLGGMMWRRATARGARWGMLGGIAVWVYTMVFPSFFDVHSTWLTLGPFGLSALRPNGLFGLQASDFVNGLVWSLSVNLLFFIVGSLSRSATPSERIQASVFINEKTLSNSAIRNLQPNVTVEQLKTTLARYIGAPQTELAFSAFHKRSNTALDDADPADFKTVHFSEQLLSETVGSPSARMILSLAMGPTNPAQRQAQILLDHATGALAQNRQLLQTALDQMDQGIGVFDNEHRLSCWNLQFQLMLDLPRELQKMGTPLDRILHGLFQRGDLVNLGKHSLTEERTGPVTPWRIKLRKTGQTIEVRSNAMPDGGLVTTFTDISAVVEADDLLRQTNESLEERVRNRTTELTLANQQLAKAQRRAEEANVGKTRFLADAGHDILQPLNAARLYSSALMERLGDLREKELVQNVDSSLEAVESIISALLDISRLDTGALTPVVSVFRLDSLLQQIARDFSPIASEKNLALRVVMSSAIIATDRNLLRRLVQNLVSNAIKYSRTGKVLIGVRRRGQSIELRVYDTGIGIAQSKLDYIFHEFARLTEGMKESDGLGLGLSIVERIAKILDVQIGVDSKIGKGSVFSVTIPLSNTSSLSVKEAQPLTQVSSSLNGMRVLCVDDNESSLTGLQELLNAWDCRVISVKTGKEIRAYCLNNQPVPDVILADYNLEEETGLDLIHFVRDHYGSPINAALITADRSEEVQQSATAADVSMINKPVRPAVLRALLSHFRQDIAAK